MIKSVMQRVLVKGYSFLDPDSNWSTSSTGILVLDARGCSLAWTSAGIMFLLNLYFQCLTGHGHEADDT